MTLVIVIQRSFGQIEKIVPPTPNAMKMTEYYAQKPNMYTGTASVNIPLYTIDFDGWKLPLTVSYNATGIRTNEEASEVGLGWGINATAVISRTIRDSDDLLKGISAERRGYVYNVSPISYSMGYNWQTQAVPPQGSYYLSLAQTRPDTQPDVFNYNFFGYSGSFVLSQKVATANVVQVIKVTQDASSISFDEEAQTFTVTTPEGFKGEFTVKEKTTSFSSSTVAIDRMQCCSESVIDIITLKSQGRYRVTSTWYLSKITSPRGQVINFNYDLNPDGSSPYLSNSRAFGELEGIESPETCLQTVQEHVYLKNIISEEVRIDFIMEDREDLKRNNLFISPSYFSASQMLKRYRTVTVKGIDAASTLNKNITFVQNYFNQQYRNGFQELENEARWMRSRLDRLIIDDQEYRFYYEKGAKGLPDKLTNGIDHFGFYNGQDQVTQLLPPSAVSGSFLGSTSNLADSTPLVYYKQRWERRVIFDYGKMGLLTKVKYPTRGYTVFEYEPHTYVPDQSGYFLEQIDPNENKAGGARIQSTKEYDYGDNLLLSKSYKYLDNPNAITHFDSPVTGKLMTPLYNRYSKQLHDMYNPPNYPVTAINFLYKTHSSIPGNNAAEGKVIGYSKVHEIVNGTTDSYRNTYYFENRANKLSTWNAVAKGHSNLNGTNKEVRNYDSQGKVVQQTKNLDYYHRYDSIRAIAYEYPSEASPYLNYVVTYSIAKTFITPFTTIITTAETPSGIAEAADGSLTYVKVLQNQKDLTYNSSFLLKSQTTTGSGGETMKSEFKRPSDYASPGANLAYMITKNMLEPVIEEITTRNGIVIAATGNYYERELPSGPRVNLKSSYSYNRTLGVFVGSANGLNFLSPYEKKTDFTYDGFSGKLNEYTGADGITNSFLWGYNAKLPIAYGMGINYTQLSAAYSTAIASSEYETTLRNQSGTAGGQVTTYTYNPLVGVTKMTGPTLLKKTYQYDTYSRLKSVLDNDGKTLEQYQYHFKELPITRYLSVSGSLDFGAFYSCKLPSAKVLTLTNDGEDDLNVTTLVIPNGFTSTWMGGTISAGTSVEMTINFTGTTGNYPNPISISSNRTDGPATITVPLNASYLPSGTAKTIQLSSNLLTFDTQFSPKQVTITNAGNECFYVTGVTIPSTPNWSASIVPATLAPGEFTTLTITRTGATPEPINVTVESTKNAGNNVVQVGLPTKVIGLSIVPFADFTTATNTTTLTLNNSGNTPLTVTGYSSNNSKFTITNTFPVTVQPGIPQVLNLLYTSTDFTAQSAIITLNSDKTSGTNTVSTGSVTRRSVRSISFAPDPLLFNGGNITQNVTITNTGNDLVYLSNPTYSFTATPGTSTTTSVDFSASIPNIATPLSAGQTRTMSVFLNKDNPLPQNINVPFNNSTGEGNKFVQVRANTRIINLSITPFADFTTSSSTTSVTLNNTGATALTVTGYTSNNSKFTITNAFPITVQPGASQLLNLLYTSTDFTAQSAILTLNSDKTSGTNTVSTGSVTRRSVRSISLTPDPLIFTVGNVTKYVTITNTGNDLVYLSSPTYSFPATPGTSTTTSTDWAASVPNIATPLSSGESRSMSVYLSTSNPQQQNINVPFNHSTGEGNKYVVVKANTRIIQLSGITFSPFTSTSASAGMTVYNSGNTPFTITSISSSNALFNVTPGSFTVPAQGQQAITVTFNPGDFSLQSSTLTFNGDFTTGTNTISVSAQRTPLRIIELSQSSMNMPAFDFATSVAQNLTVSNSGNTTLSISSASSNNAMFNASPAAFTLSPGGSQTVTITFTPTAYNFSQQTGTITFNGDQTSGNNSISLSGQRTSLKTIQLSASSLVYTYTGQAQTVNISNTGNDILNITGATAGIANSWAIALTPAPLSPGQSTSMTITRLTNSEPGPIDVSVFSDKNGGNEIVHVTAITRTLTLSGISFPTFGGASSTQPITVGNSGNSTLTLNSSSSSNSRFTLSPGSFSVPPGGQQTVNVTYTPTDFTSQSTTLTFNSDATNYPGYTTINTSAQRTQNYQMSVSPGSVVVKPSAQTQTITVFNSGNVDATITAIGNNNTSKFTATYWMLSGGSFVQFTSLPYTIPAGSQMQIRVVSADGSYTSASGTITVVNNQGTNYVVNTSRATF